MQTLTKVASDWETLVTSYGDRPEHTMEWFNFLHWSYTQPFRRFHTLFRAHAVVTNVFEIASKEHISDTRGIEFAAWFHNVVYDPAAYNNEQESADIAEKALTDLEFPPMYVDGVTTIITSLANYDPNSFMLYPQVMNDAVYGWLASAPHSFRSYRNLLREEHAIFSDIEWVEFRLEWIEKMLDRQRIFLTNTCRRFEKMARENLEAEKIHLVQIRSYLDDDANVF